MLLVVTCLLASFSFYNIRSIAKATKIGTVTGEGVNFRTGPSTSYTSLGKLSKGTTGEVLETSGNWHKMSISGKGEGWVSATYVSVTVSGYEYDEAFEQYLNQQEFPESYRESLRGLHALYPNWVFEAQKTNLNWDVVISEESALGKNLVSKDSIASWKSTQTGAYNWDTKEWVIFDSGGWVMASEAMIKYCMDPRNFLDTTNIFQFIKQSYNASALNSAELIQKKTELSNMVSGTYLAGNCEGRSYVDVIMEVAAGTGVCPYTLASMMIQEQGAAGTGGSISGTNATFPDTYNYFNIGAYKDSSLGLEAVERGLWYAQGAGSGATTYYRPWKTRTAAIWGGASYYGINYVNVGQDTMYLKKFNVQGPDIYSHQYMTNVQGAISEGRHIAEAYDEDARNATLVFKIPVYDNMPESACQKPTGNNAPTQGGSAGGTTSGGSTGAVPAPSVGSSNYQVNSNSTITGISDFATINVSDFLNKLSIANGSVKITNSSGSVKAGTSKIGTGDQVRLYNSSGGHTTTYNIIVYGDTNGNGIVNAQDLLLIQKNNIKVSALGGVYSTAADVNRDGKVNAQDLLLVQKHNIKVQSIRQ